jgi:hypothetical protein
VPVRRPEQQLNLITVAPDLSGVWVYMAIQPEDTYPGVALL